MKIDARDDRRGLTAMASIRRYARPRRAAERCEICEAGLSADHSHLIESSTGRMACACEPCAILLGNQAGARYRRVPRLARFLPDFRFSDELWEEFSIPINLAFFLRSTPAGGVVGLYPGPAGATESPVAEEAWEALAEENPILRRLEPDVEGLLVNRVGEARECYRVGLDECYRLVGLIRTNWRGMTGGTAIWHEIARFFEGLKGRSDHA